MGLFYLLTLYCGIRGAASAHPGRWYLAAIVACCAGHGLQGGDGHARRSSCCSTTGCSCARVRRGVTPPLGLYAGLAATWLLLAFRARHEQGRRAGGDGGRTSRPGATRSRQFGVIVHYLRLRAGRAAGPGLRVAAGRVGRRVLPRAILVLALLAATAWRSSAAWAGFWGAWFFLDPRPHLERLPIADLAFEHRMYLPLAAVVVLAVIGGYELARECLPTLAAPAAASMRAIRAGRRRVVALSATTTRRNEDYRSEQAMWSDNVAKRPDNPRAHYNLGNILTVGKPGEAISHYPEAVRLKPDYVDPHVNFGAVLFAQGELPEAIAQFTEAVRLKPDSRRPTTISAPPLQPGQGEGGRRAPHGDGAPQPERGRTALQPGRCACDAGPVRGSHRPVQRRVGHRAQSSGGAQLPKGRSGEP